MPEFQLDFELPKPLPPLKRSFVTKNEYNEKVKITDWDRAREGEPKDYNAFDPPGGSITRSTYNSFGTSKNIKWISETNHCMQQIHKITPCVEVIEPMPMISYGTYKETEGAPYVGKKDYWPDYLSTTHASYKCPFPYVMKPLTMPETPWFLYRRMTTEDPMYETNKFLDDCYVSRTRNMIEHKKKCHRSYNPFTGIYTDGSRPPEVKKMCRPLPYDVLQ